MNVDLLPGLLEALEVVEVQALFLQRPHERSAEPLHSGSTYMYEAVERNPEPGQLSLELIGGVLRAPVVAVNEPLRAILGA